MFSGCIVMPDSKETELGSSNQEAFPSADKNSGKVLVLCCAWKCAPTVISGDVDIFEVPGCHLFVTHEFSVRSQRLLQGLISYELTAYLSVFILF